MSYQHTINFLLEPWDMRGATYTPPSRQFVLSTGLDSAYESVKAVVESTFCPSGTVVRVTLTSDGRVPRVASKTVFFFNHF